MKETKATVTYQVKNGNTSCSCVECRHCNRNTDDFEDDFIFCSLQPGIRTLDSTCDIEIAIGDNEEMYYMFEPSFMGNSTWDLLGEIVVDTNEVNE